MSKKLKTRKGITLVSLVITIIILLILAGITINLTIGEDGIIRRAQAAGKNYIDAAENEKLQLGQFTNEMDNIISGSTNNGRVQYNSEFRKNVVKAINEAGVETSETDADETIVKNIGKILKEKTKNATATADNISEGKTAWVNGELITGNGADNEAYKAFAGRLYCFEKYEGSDISIGAKKTVTVTASALREVAGVLCEAVWGNGYRDYALNILDYAGESHTIADLSSLNITFNGDNTVTIQNGHASTGCRVYSLYFIGYL